MRPTYPSEVCIALDRFVPCVSWFLAGRELNRPREDKLRLCSAPFSQRCLSRQERRVRSVGWLPGEPRTPLQKTFVENWHEPRLWL